MTNSALVRDLDARACDYSTAFVILSAWLRRQTTMTSIRAIGRWALTALVINSIIGSAIFGLPSVLIRLLGTASPLAMMAAALMMSIIMLCAVEVASHFSEAGGLTCMSELPSGGLPRCRLAGSGFCR